MNQSSSELNDAVLGDVTALDALFDPLDVDLAPFHDDAGIAWGSPTKPSEPTFQRSTTAQASLQQRLAWLGR